MVPYFTMRSPMEQASLWKQGRNLAVIEQKIMNLEFQGAFYIASCLKKAPAQKGNIVTNAIPGLSWHQYGEAVDCYWNTDGKANWSVTQKINNQNGYYVYAEEAEKLDLTAGGLWTMADWPHVQLRPESSPLKIMSIKEVDALMKKTFG